MTGDKKLIERIHASETPFVLALTGGGSGAIAALLEVPGASAVVLEAVVPYAATALQKWLGGPVDHYCSERTARAMAMASFERARALSDAGPQVLRGIGATASLATTRPKRGPHRMHVAWQSAASTVVSSCELAKGERTRAEEELLAAEFVLDVIAEACGVARPSLSAPISSTIDRREMRAPRDWTELLLGERQFVRGWIADADSSVPQILFPGAFNPLHAGHRRMAGIAAERYKKPVTFELSIANVDKPPLDFIEIADRLAQFVGDRVLLTRAATFVEKARIAPGCIFVVGIDTLVRISEPVYYGCDPARRDAAIAAIAGVGCRFLVFGRASDGVFQDLSSHNLPPALRALCDEVPESIFREDISSTELRGE